MYTCYLTCCCCCCCCCIFSFTLPTDAAKQLHDKGGNLPTYKKLLQPHLGEWALPLLALLLFELQVRHGKGGRQKEGNPIEKDPELSTSLAVRKLKNRDAAARSKLKKKIPKQVTALCIVHVTSLVWWW
jgi:hypothetical protein